MLDVKTLLIYWWALISNNATPILTFRYGYSKHSWENIEQDVFQRCWGDRDEGTWSWTGIFQGNWCRGNIHFLPLSQKSGTIIVKYQTSWVWAGPS